MRKSFSPIKPSVLPKVYEKIGLDQRDHIIRKLKQDLIIARGKAKEISILQHYLGNLLDKTKILQIQRLKQLQQHKMRLQTTNRAINEQKKDLQIMKGQYKTSFQQLSQQQANYHQLKRILDGKSIEVQRMKDDSLYLYNQHQKLLQENYRLKIQFDNGVNDNRRVLSTKQDLDNRISQINRKIAQVKAYLASLKDQQEILKNKLGNYQVENNQIGANIDIKQDNIDILEHQFARKHDDIKRQVQIYIQIQHQNQKYFQETRHKHNLLKIENQKSIELNLIITNLQKTLHDQHKAVQQVKTENRQIDLGIRQYEVNNQQLKRDLTKCQDHLQNLLGWNANLHKKLDQYVKQDDQIIYLIKNKRRYTQTTTDSYRSIGRY